MLIRKNGTYKTIDREDFGIYQALGFEKVIEKQTIVTDLKPIEEVKEEIETKEEGIQNNELPKPKRRRKSN